jgi:hypothetical protein
VATASPWLQEPPSRGPCRADAQAGLPEHRAERGRRSAWRLLTLTTWPLGSLFPRRALGRRRAQVEMTCGGCGLPGRRPSLQYHPADSVLVAGPIAGPPLWRAGLPLAPGGRGAAAPAIPSPGRPGVACRSSRRSPLGMAGLTCEGCCMGFWSPGRRHATWAPLRRAGRRPCSSPRPAGLADACPRRPGAPGGFLWERNR